MELLTGEVLLEHVDDDVRGLQVRAPVLLPDVVRGVVAGEHDEVRVRVLLGDGLDHGLEGPGRQVAAKVAEELRRGLVRLGRTVGRRAADRLPAVRPCADLRNIDGIDTFVLFTSGMTS